MAIDLARKYPLFLEIGDDVEKAIRRFSEAEEGLLAVVKLIPEIGRRKEVRGVPKHPPFPREPQAHGTGSRLHRAIRGNPVYGRTTVADSLPLILRGNPRSEFLRQTL